MGINSIDNRQKSVQIASSVTGIAVGAAAYEFTNKAINKLNSIPHKAIRQNYKTINNEEIKNTVSKMFIASGLGDKGVKITNLSNCDYSQQLEELKKRENAILKNKEIGIFKKLKHVISNAKQELKLKMMQTIALGRNAAFDSSKNEILINLDKRAISLTHEMGHAQNMHFSRFWNIIQKSQGYFKLSIPLIALIAVLKPKKGKDEESHGVVDKTTSFVKDNAGKLTALASVPIVAEEIKASVNGNKLAKQFYSPELYKKVLKETKLAAMTYVISAIAATAAVWTAKNVRDKIAQTKI